jgi:hypothetical protein
MMILKSYIPDERNFVLSILTVRGAALAVLKGRSGRGSLSPLADWNRKMELNCSQAQSLESQWHVAMTTLPTP